MAFPVARSTHLYVQGSNSAAWSIDLSLLDLESGETQAIVTGDLILVGFGRDGTSGTPAITGYTAMGDFAVGTAAEGGAFVKVAVVGDEALPTISFAPGASEQGVVHVAVLRDWYGAITNGVMVGTSASGTTNVPNPPSVTATWGAADNYFRAMVAHDNGLRTVTGFPTGYDIASSGGASGGGSGAGFGSAGKQSTGATDDAGTFTLNSADDWVAWTIIIRGNAAITTKVHAQAQAYIKSTTKVHAQAQAQIKVIGRGFGQAQAQIPSAGSACYYDTVIADGAINYYRMAETSGTAMVDEIGSQNGTYAGSFTLDQPGLLSGDTNAAVKVFGAGGGTLPAAVNPWAGTNWSVECWFECDLDDGYQGIFSTGTYLTNGFRLGRQSDKIHFWTSENVPPTGGFDIGSSGPYVKAGQRVHLVATKTGSAFELWVNGVSSGTSSGTYVAPTGPTNNVFELNGGTGMTGTLDELAIYADALTSTQIKDHFRRGAGYAAHVLLDAPVGYWRLGDTLDAYVTTILDDSPVGYWRLGESSGTTADNAEGTAAIDGTYVGTPTLGATGGLAGDADTAMTVNGTTQYVTVPDNAALDLGDVLSIEAWVRRTGNYAQNYSYIVSKGDQGGLSFNSADEVLWDNDGSVCSTSSVTITDSLWHHIVATRDDTNDKIYVDGVDVTVVGTEAGRSSNADDLSIGRYSGTGNYLAGDIDEVAVYGVALTADQVRRHYHAGVGVVDQAGAVISNTALGAYVGGVTLGQTGALSNDSDTAVLFDDVAGTAVLVPAYAAQFLDNGPFSIEAWYKRADLSSQGYIWTESLGAYIYPDFDGSIYFGAATVGDAGQTAASWDDLDWHHVVVTKDTGDTSWKIYIDGVDVTPTITSRAIAGTFEHVKEIGGSTTDAWDGDLDEVAIYTSVLTPTQVADHYEARSVSCGSRAYGQAQATIVISGATTSRGYAQSQAQIKTSYQVYAQSQASVKTNYKAFAQAQARIKQTYKVYAQGQARIKTSYQVYAQSQASVKTNYKAFAQAQARIKQTYKVYAQGQASIKTSYQVYAQAQARILANYQSYAQAQTKISAFAVKGFAQVRSFISSPYLISETFSGGTALPYDWTQHLATIDNSVGYDDSNSLHWTGSLGYDWEAHNTSYVGGQWYTLTFWMITSVATSTSGAGVVPEGIGQGGIVITTASLPTIWTKYTKVWYQVSNGSGNLVLTNSYGGASTGDIWIDLVQITKGGYPRGQAQAQIKQGYSGYAQAQAHIKQTYIVNSQAQANIKQVYLTYSQAQASIRGNAFGQANAWIKQTGNLVSAQAQADIKTSYQGYAQSQAKILRAYNVFAQAQANIKATSIVFAQAQAQIKTIYKSYAQSQAKIILSELQSYAQTNVGIKQTYPSNGTVGDLSIVAHGASIDSLLLLGARYDGATYYGIVLSADTSNTYGYGINHNVLALVRLGTGGANLVVSDLGPGVGNIGGPWQIRFEIWGDPSDVHLRGMAWKTGEPTFDWTVATDSYIGSIRSDSTTVFNVTIDSTDRLVLGPTFAQSQAQIKQAYLIFAQANANIKQTYNGYGQAQAAIKGNAFAQAQANIKQVYLTYSQAQARINQTYQSFAQAQAGIKTSYQAYAQAQSQIKQIYQTYAQAQVDIKVVTQVYAQAQSSIKAVSQTFAQSQAQIKQAYLIFAQANANIKQTYKVFAQVQADIKTTYQNFAQAQADILVTTNRFAQAQVWIESTNNEFAQAQTNIKATTNIHAQAQAKINSFGFQAYAQALGNIKGAAANYAQAQAKINAFNVQAYGQSNADIKAVSEVFAQAQGAVLTAYQAYAQAQASILVITNRFAQAQANIKQTYVGVAQSQADIKQSYQVYAQAQANIKQVYIACGQAQANIQTTYNIFAQANADIKQVYVGYAQSNANIKATSNVFAQAQADIKVTTNVFAQTQANITQNYYGFAQANSDIKATSNRFGQAQATIRGNAYGQVQADILVTTKVYTQSQAQIKQTYKIFAQAQGSIKSVYKVFAQTQTDIKATSKVFSQSQADIKQVYNTYAQAQADIKQTYKVFAQAQTNILQAYLGFGQAQASVLQVYKVFAQANADILQVYKVYSQAQTYIIINGINTHAQAQGTILQTYQPYAQAQAKINAFNVQAYGQAQGNVQFNGDTRHAQAQTKILAFNYPQSGQAQGTVLAVYKNFAQAQTSILAVYDAHAQAQADILQVYQEYSQAQADIVQIYQEYAQAQALIVVVGIDAFAQAQATIRQTYNSFAQVNADIHAIDNAFGQANASILGAKQSYAQSQAGINATTEAFGQANADIKATGNTFGQAQADIKRTEQGYAQANAAIIQTEQMYAQAQASIKTNYQAYTQSQALIVTLGIIVSAQAQADIKQLYQEYAQAQASIIETKQIYAQAQAYILGNIYSFAQTNADIKATINRFAQAQGNIKQVYQSYAQAQSLITTLRQGYGQAQGAIKVSTSKVGQAQADILVTTRRYANAQALITTNVIRVAQAQATIKSNISSIAQAQAYITSGTLGVGQAQADIQATYTGIAQAQAFISKLAGYAQAQAVIRIAHTLKKLIISDNISISLILNDKDTEIESLSLELSDSTKIALMLSDRKYPRA